MKPDRVSVLGIAIDSIPPEALETVIESFEDGKNHQVILLSVWDLMRARHRREYRTMLAGADLVIPISLSLVKAARFLKKQEPIRYLPFDFVVKTLGVLERRGKSVYLLGSTRGRLQKAEINIKSTFPGLRVVGRFAGRYPKHQEGAIIEAVRKATPSLMLVGRGIPGKERWIPRNLPKFNSGIYLWCSDLFDVFAAARSKPSRELFERGLEWLSYLARRPWKIYRLFIFAWFKILLLAERIRQR